MSKGITWDDKGSTKGDFGSPFHHRAEERPGPLRGVTENLNKGMHCSIAPNTMIPRHVQMGMVIRVSPRERGQRSDGFVRVSCSRARGRWQPQVTSRSRLQVRLVRGEEAVRKEEKDEVAGLLNKMIIMS
ncbi:hypothetical protein CDL15_Pgr024671 [Punica granatum]|uniref:Uncharacterized protein n=1 Tax=Punica granatum TaxID=22663 RepID=A0A218W4M4_PUNGR|nr:hypothetical protein CDL15_Pgr024671 [Punica granatum]